MLVSLGVALSLVFATGVSANAATVGNDFLQPVLGYYIDLDRTDVVWVDCWSA